MPNTPEIDKEVALLKSKKHLLSEKDEAFAHSLIQFHENRGFLSIKQLPFITSLLDRCSKLEATQERSVEEIFNGHLIRSLLTTARANLKYPTLKLQSDNCGVIRFYIAGPLAHRPGYIVIDNGRTPPNKVRYGSIDASGAGSLERTADTAVKSFIRRIASNPVAEAKLCGVKFSHCCFCGLELTAAVSVHHGYGPVCADNWGLPWEGPKPLEDVAAEKLASQIGEGLIDLGQGEHK